MPTRKIGQIISGRAVKKTHAVKDQINTDQLIKNSNLTFLKYTRVKIAVITQVSGTA